MSSGMPTRQDILLYRHSMSSYGETTGTRICDMLLEQLTETERLSSLVKSNDNTLAEFGVADLDALIDKVSRKYRRYQLALAAIRNTVELIEEDDGPATTDEARPAPDSPADSEDGSPGSVDN